MCVQIVSQRNLTKALLRPGGTVGKTIITVSLSAECWIRFSWDPVQIRFCFQSPEPAPLGPVLLTAAGPLDLPDLNIQCLFLT